MSGVEGLGTRFVVQWEEHPSHLASRLGQLLEQQTLVDVTLMCNTHTLRVHRSVLAACSPYFENLLQNISQRQLVQHPLIVLKDMQFSVLKCMIEFMYCGETNVTEDDLGPLLQAARFFQVKGLSSMTKEALGLPPRPAKSKVNGEVPKAIPKPSPVPISGPRTVVSKPLQPAKTLAVRESPGLGSSAASDPAELLLSLSGESKSSSLTQQQAAKPQLMKQSPQRGWISRPIGAAVDSSFQLAPNQPEGTSPVYQPGPRKRGRPLKRQMNLVFQEKVISDTEMALRKEAEASRRALETLQKEMSSESEETDQQPATRSEQPKQHINLVAKAGKKSETEDTTEGETVTYQISESGTSMSHYMEVLKEAGLPMDVPILMDSGDGNYVTVNEEVLMNIVNGGGLQYQVTEEPARSDGELLSEEAAAQMQQQVVRYVDDNGDIVEGVLAVVQEGEEGTTVAVTPSGQVVQIQSEGETYQLVEAPAESSTEDLISGDLETTKSVEEEQSNKRPAETESGSTNAKKLKLERD